MESIKRLLKFINHKGLTKRQFYAATTLPNGFLNSTKTLTSSSLEKIHFVYPDLNIFWLLFNEGDMLIGDNNSKLYRNYLANEPEEEYRRFFTNQRTEQTDLSIDERVQILESDNVMIKRLLSQLISLMDDRGVAK